MVLKNSKIIIPKLIIPVIAVIILISVFVHTKQQIDNPDIYQMVLPAYIEQPIALPTKFETKRPYLSYGLSTENVIKETVSSHEREVDSDVVEDIENTYINTDMEDRKDVYDYAPCVIVEDDIYHIWYCSNAVEGEIRDHIYYVKGKVLDNGAISYSDAEIVLSPGDVWDAEHVCDPSVIKGDFRLHKKRYVYMMAYLGCNTTNNQENMIGAAFANDIEGPWIKMDDPLVSFDRDLNYNSHFQWGVGQPSLIYHNNQIWMFYTKGEWDKTSERLAVFNPDEMELIYDIAVTNKGTDDFISNADVAFLPGDFFVLACDDHPFSGKELNIISDSVGLYYTPFTYNDGQIAINKWNVWNELTKDETGYQNNHNVCFVKAPDGSLYEKSLFISIAQENSDFLSSLFTYRITKFDF